MKGESLGSHLRSEAVLAATPSSRRSRQNQMNRLLDLADEVDLLESEVERLRAGRGAVLSVLRDWGALEEGETFAETFSEAVAESGAWRLARDLRQALEDAS